MTKTLYVIAKIILIFKELKARPARYPFPKSQNRLVTETAEKADVHNQHFPSVFTAKGPLSLSRLCKMKLQDAIDHGKLPSETLPPGVLKSTLVMEDVGVSVAGILNLLRNLKPRKAAGPDKLKPILLKELSEEIAPIIKVIFERSIQTGKLPAEWCRGQVTPIFKKGDKSSAANYRPISLTCILCKMLEHILTSHMVKHLENDSTSMTFCMIYNMVLEQKGHVKHSLPCCSSTLLGTQVQTKKLI